MFKRLKKELSLNQDLPLLNFQIPRDPQHFYESFGLLTHPFTGKPVEKLTEYQKQWWKYPSNAIAIKSQKIGLTTTSLMEDFQYTILKEGAGKDVLVIAQNLQLARDHILTLKKMIRESTRYRKFLIETTSDLLFAEEQTKTSVIFVKNPYNPRKPSRIIGLGSSESSVWSWKNVGKVHMSDVAKLTIGEQEQFFGAVFSRLANTRGIVKIETPPAGQQGFVYKLFEANRDRVPSEIDLEDEWSGEDPAENVKMFKVFAFHSREAVAAGVMSDEWLQDQRKIHGDLMFSQLYECTFIAPGNQWYDVGWMKEGYHPMSD